jgi:uncharacterized membrane protein
MTRVLVVGETWISHATHVKGFDSFTSGTFHSGLAPLRAALEANGISVDHMPAHEAAEGFPLELDGLARWDVIVLSDVGADTLLPRMSGSAALLPTACASCTTGCSRAAVSWPAGT